MPARTVPAAVLSALLLAGAAATTVRADNGVDIDAKAKEVVKSLVVVEYTQANENASHPESGQGLLIQKDGIVLISGALIPEALPKEWIKDLKVRLPLSDFTSVPATFLGRTRDRLFAFLKLEKPIDAPVFEPGDMAPTKLGQNVFAVGMLSKGAGYGTYVGVSRVKAVMDLTHQIALTGTFGLTCATSPVFDAQSGNMVGITLPALGDGVLMRIGDKAVPIELADEEQSSDFLPQNEISDLFKNIPTKPFHIDRAWLGVTQLVGLPEELKAVKHIEQPSGVTIGSVIPNQVADKAGLQDGDIILTVDGKQFSKSPVPELMVKHFERLIEKHRPGDALTFGILRDSKKMDIKVKLGTAPTEGSDMPHVFSPRIGVVTRDLVFADAYARKLPQDTKGVMVVLVKSGAPASLGSTPLQAGLLITKVNDQPVDNEKQFLAAMKKIDADKDAKEAVFVVIETNGDTSVRRVDLTK